VDPDMALLDATKKANSIQRSLPDDMDEPSVMKRSNDDIPVMEIAVTSSKSLTEMKWSAEYIFQDELAKAGGVSEVEVMGQELQDVIVDVDKDKLRFYDFSLNDIVKVIGQETVLVPAGSVYTEKKEINVRLVEQYNSLEDVRNLQLTNNDGLTVYLSQLADIQIKDTRKTNYSRVDGQETISMIVFKNSDANVVQTAEAVNEKLDELREKYPDYQFTIVSETAKYVKQSLHNTLGTLIEGIITTSLVLYFFLRGWRSSLMVAIAIPTSLIASIFIMYLAGFTFNMLSLLGMTLCIGILVDDSIVVLENIHRHLAMGKSAAQAAEDGRMEIGLAAIAITLCDVVVFLPIAFMSGTVGQLFRQFGLTIVFATLFSLFISFTLTPMLASKFYQNGLIEPEGRLWSFFDQAEKKLLLNYERFLRWSIEHWKRILLSVTIVFMSVMSLLPLGLIGSEYMPQTDEGTIRISLDLPIGMNVGETDKVVREVEKFVADIPEVKHYLSYVGRSGENKANITVQLVNKKDRRRDIWQIIEEIRKFTASFSDVRVMVNAEQSSMGTGKGGIGGNAALQFELLGSDNGSLEKAAEEMVSYMQKMRGVRDVKSSYEDGMPEYKLQVDRRRLNYYGLSLSDVENTFRTAIAGKTAGVVTGDVSNNGEDRDILVRLKNGDSFQPSDLEYIAVGEGEQQIYLGQIAEVKKSTGPLTIRRVDKARSIRLQANLSDRSLQDAMNEIKQKIESDYTKQGIKYQFTGQGKSMDDTFKQMFMALALSIILVYMLLAVLYESVLTPFIRMLSLPLGLIGSLFCLFITGNTINLYSLIGILVMDGLVAKNGTLLLDYTLHLKAEGVDPVNAVIQAGKTRLRAILMTSFTMVAGMLPTALALSEGSESKVSMAWVIIGGMISSTFFTLIVIPIVFILLEKKFSKRLIK
ncbi:MAG: efflux RND transporter permease subunit, partial [bacterium]